MCISLPGQVTEVKGAMVEVRRGHRTAWFNALMVPGLEVGAWVFTQTNLVMAEVSAEQAQDALGALDELERKMAEDHQPSR